MGTLPRRGLMWRFSANFSFRGLLSKSSSEMSLAESFRRAAWVIEY